MKSSTSHTPRVIWFGLLSAALVSVVSATSGVHAIATLLPGYGPVHPHDPFIPVVASESLYDNAAHSTAPSPHLQKLLNRHHSSTGNLPALAMQQGHAPLSPVPELQNDTLASVKSCLNPESTLPAPAVCSPPTQTVPRS